MAEGYKVRGPKGQEQGWGSCGGAPSPPARGFGERCKLPQRGPGWSPAGKQFCHIWSTQEGLIAHCSKRL